MQNIDKINNKVYNKVNNKVYTDWTPAKVNYQDALISLQACRGSHAVCWLELRDNGDQTYPIKMPNPLLEDPFAWRHSYGTITSPSNLKAHKFLNETERDLTYNWIAGYGNPEAIAKYKENRELAEGLCMGIGNVKCFPIRIEDAQKYRDTFIKDGYRYGKPGEETCFVDFWSPKDGIPFYVPDQNVGKVLVVCYSKVGNTMSEADSIAKTAATLSEYAEYLRNKEASYEKK